MIIFTHLEDITIENVLKKFEDLYHQKEYAKALQTLKQHPQSLDAGLWHFNVGTLEAQLDNWPLARYHLITAEDKGYSHEKTRLNLKLVEEKLEVARWEKPLNARDYVMKASLFATEGLFTTLSLLVLVIGLLLLKKKASLLRLIGMVLGVLIPVGFSLWVQSWPKAIVLSSQSIAEGPSAIFAARGELPEGLFIIYEDKGDWKKIIYPSRFQGWIKSEGIQALE